MMVRDIIPALLTLLLLPLTAQEPPPRNIPIDEMEYEELEDKDTGPWGEVALKIRPERWRHAETENYVLHFRRITEARKVARELEFNIWYVARLLDAKPEDFQDKGHAFIFEDEDEWQEFIVETKVPEWSGSFAHGDNLFLNVRKEFAGNFDSNTLAHEATHAVVARLYPRRRWPLYLNEGFAEFVAAAGVAERKNQTLERHLSELPNAVFNLEELTAITAAYPVGNSQAVTTLYQSGEKLLRVLMMELPRERFPKFVEAILGSNNDFEASIMEVYGDKLESFEEFRELYREFEL